MPARFHFRTLDDFHPDDLYRRLNLFKSLRDARERLEDPDTYNETAQQIFNPPTAQATMDIIEPSSLLDQAIEEADGGHSTDPFTEYLRKLVAPYTIPKTRSQNFRRLLAEIDAAVSGNMRADSA